MILRILVFLAAILYGESIAVSVQDSTKASAKDSDPDTIREEFGMSKKTFKKILGTLFREGKIDLGDDGFRAV